MIANTLIHREYTSSYQAKFVIEKDRIYTENANRASQEAVLTPDNITPSPKNTIIAAFFRNIGYADQLGSGVRNLFKYSKYYSRKETQFVEGNVFKIVVTLDEKFTVDNHTQSTTQSTTQLTTQLMISTSEKIILELLRNEPAISQKEIALRLNMNANTVKYYIRKMQKNGKIIREGTNRKGKWIIL